MQIMANLSQDECVVNKPGLCAYIRFNVCYPQVCTQIENRYLIKI